MRLFLLEVISGRLDVEVEQQGLFQEGALVVWVDHLRAEEIYRVQ